ncbi:craniofacial development protein 2-like [Penaeus indicus]|uniref:craniofacial development protein 2-like n=1 Tax=Penaeus indicus TaxID=29960 RepID=UPI00300CBEA5
MMEEKNIEVLCVQETRWAGNKALEISKGYKLFYNGTVNARNGVGIILCPELKDKVVSVNRKTDRTMSVTIVIKGECWTMVSCYAPQVGCDNDEKFLEGTWTVLCRG